MKPAIAKLSTLKIDYKVDKTLKSHANDPFILKKAAKSKAFLEKHGFPEEYMKRR